jgi:hypothetical protein
MPTPGCGSLPRIRRHKGDEQVFRIGGTIPMKKPAHHLIAEVPRRQTRIETTMAIDLATGVSPACSTKTAK